jgi:branched-chain amino acid transport system ATP-binding protein
MSTSDAADPTLSNGTGASSNGSGGAAAGSATSSAPRRDAPPLLELRGVTAAYGRIEVLHGIDLAVAEGSVCALLGPNGAGKTTTISVCSGLMVPTGGDLFIAGRRINGASPDQLARAGVCTVPEGRGIFPNLTVAENLQMMTLTGRSMAEVEATAYERFPRLAERRKQVAGTLSGGEQQMLSLARGLATSPALLLLDELSMGLAPMIVEELYGIVAQIASSGVSILVVEQFARTVLGVADTAALMLHGHVTRLGSPQEIEQELSSAYLGGESGSPATS